LACSYLLGSSGDGIDATLAALQGQQTDLAETLAAFTAIAQEAGGSTQIAQSTIDASLATATSQAELAATLSSLPVVSTPLPPADPDERLLKSAKILLFEDMSASRYIRIAKEALDQGGYFYQDVGSAKGWFKSQLLSDVEWDLVIAAAEVNNEFGGEFFEYINDQIEKGASAIVENWDFDLAPQGKAGSLLARCGVNLESDWFEPQMQAIFWLTPDDPIFHQPNKVSVTLRTSRGPGFGDMGDMLEVDRDLAENGGNPTPLAGLNSSWKDSHALLVSCLGGRLILQTFRTHEYHHDDMLALWGNYIYAGLKSRFAFSGNTIPTPARTALPAAEGTRTPAGPTPGPEYIFAHGCDGIFSVRFLNAPHFQKDLFEHHANGLFLILRVQIQSQVDFPIMVWDGDYFVEGQQGPRELIYQPDKAATGYLYIEGPGALIQDLIQPGETRQVSLAFDVNPNAADLTFAFRPGSEFNEQVCEANIAINR
jgi:hypothetical protein